MANVLSLVRCNDNGDEGGGSLSLLDFTNGISLPDNGWQQSIDGQPGSNTVTESMTLIIRGTSHDNLAVNLQALDLKIAQVGFYAENEVETYGVVLRVKMNNETGTRQALIRSAQRSPAPLWTKPAMQSALGYNYVVSYILTLERMAVWESPTFLSHPENTAVSAIGGTEALGSVSGDVPARLVQTIFDSEAPQTVPLTKVWLGFRTDRFGARNNFQPYWSLRKGVWFQADTTGGTSHADAAAKDGFRTQTTFASFTSMQQRVKVTVAAVTTNEDDQRGKFLVLLRARASASGSVIRVRLEDGLSNSPSFNVRSRVVITSNTYLFYEMGTVQLPSTGRAYNYAGTPTLNESAMVMSAERVSGSASLYMDCLVLIPIAEGWIYGRINPHIVGDHGMLLNQFLKVLTLPDDSVHAIYLEGTVPFGTAEARLTGGLPVGAVNIVVAAQRETESNIADIINLIVSYSHRWNTLRGTE